ncbi:MAG: dihydrodipicolinate synthase family protein [Actinomycetaceae bacterium]|nr:dihydrodipicolinate synthase family protein [Actinomycetaceae bacterium]
MDFKLKGVVPPVTTPLTIDRKLDITSFERGINRMIDVGVNGLFFGGSSGEIAFLTDELRTQVLSEAVRIVQGRVPILAGVIDMQTERMVQHAQEARSLGFNAIVATAPFYAINSEVEIEQNFRCLAEVGLPVFAYDIPVCVHRKLSNELLVRLGSEGILAGVKDSSGDDVAFRLLCLANKDAGHPLSLLTGHEVVVDGAYLGGADGCVPGLANVAPELYVEQWNAAQDGNWAQVAALQDKAARLMKIAMSATATKGYGVGVGGFKTALMLMGIYSSNQMSRPVSRLEGADVDRIETILKAEGLL